MDDHNLSFESADLLDRAKEIQGPDASDKERIRSKLMASIAIGAAAGATAASAEAGATIAQSGALSSAGTASSGTASLGTTASASTLASGSTTALAGTAAKLGLTKLLVGAAVVIGGASGAGYWISSRPPQSVLKNTPALTSPAPAQVQSKVAMPKQIIAPIPEHSIEEDVVPPVKEEARVQSPSKPDSIKARKTAPPANEARNTTIVPPATRHNNERALISKAMSSLRQGSPKAALVSLDEHEKRFPHGALRQEREALRTSSKCHLIPDKREELAEAFLERWPNSLLGKKVKDACDKP